MRRVTTSLVLLFAISTSHAIEVGRLDVTEEGENYVVRFEALLAAPLAAVMRVLTDYARYPELDSRILLAERARLPDGSLGLHTRLRGCLGSVFCTTMDRYEALSEEPERLRAKAVTEIGDLRHGLTETRLKAEEDGTRVSYVTEFEPSFWMPRWLVRRAMFRTLRDGTLEMFTAIEARAAVGVVQ